jgi:hypothetical protein
MLRTTFQQLYRHAVGFDIVGQSIAMQNAPDVNGVCIEGLHLFTVAHVQAPPRFDVSDTEESSEAVFLYADRSGSMVPRDADLISGAGPVVMTFLAEPSTRRILCVLHRFHLLLPDHEPAIIRFYVRTENRDAVLRPALLMSPDWIASRRVLSMPHVARVHPAQDLDHALRDCLPHSLFPTFEAIVRRLDGLSVDDQRRGILLETLDVVFLDVCLVSADPTDQNMVYRITTLDSAFTALLYVSHMSEHCGLELPAGASMSSTVFTLFHVRARRSCSQPLILEMNVRNGSGLLRTLTFDHDTWCRALWHLFSTYLRMGNETVS